MTRFWSLISRLKSYKSLVVASVVCNILTAIFTVVSIPLIIPFFQILFDRSPLVISAQEAESLDGYIKAQFTEIIRSYDRHDALLFVCAVIVVVFLLKNVFRYLSMLFMAPVRNRIIRDIRAELFDKFMKLPLSFYSSEKKGDLMSRMTLDVQEVQQSILSVIVVIFKSPIIIIGSIVFMLYVSPSLTLFVFALMFFTIFIIGAVSRTLKRESQLAQSKIARLNSVVEESLSGIRTIKGYNAQMLQQEKFNHENESYRSIMTKLFWRKDLSSPLSEFLGIVVVAVLLWYGSVQVFNETLSPETFFAFVFAFYQVIEPSKSFSSAYYNIQKGLGGLYRINEIMDVDLKMEEPVNALVANGFSDKIEYSHVSFSYDEDTPVLEDINLKIEKGDFIAVVGASGEGKSTLIDLLPRFYDIDHGEISIDGRSITLFSLDSLRGLFGIVSQEPVLFNDSVASNIKFGRKGYSMDDIIEASKIANAHDFIMALSDGYQTSIGDRGVKLSGGQRQRITIARAILGNPPILILDEATSSLDSHAEQQVQQALENVMKERTAIVIAHRLSTIMKADKIIVIKGGRIVESGSHNSLIAANGTYAELVEMQKF